MDVSNNISQYRIPSSVKVAQKQQVYRANNSGLQIDKDGFQKTPYKFSAVQYPNGFSIYNNYNSSQLLRASLNKEYLQGLVDANPNIEEILSSYGLECNIYPENITNIIDSHLTTTKAYALQIANEMQLSPADKQVLEQACLFHDIGKVFIPKEILEKPSELTDSEKEIMDLHAKLGYELLSSTGINKRVLNLIGNHHKPIKQNRDVLGQILSVADIYSALREQRSYKKPLMQYDAIKILDQKAKCGEVSTEVVDALKSSLLSTSRYAM